MPILQNRLKLLIDAAAMREQQIIDLHSEIQRIVESTPDSELRISIQTTLQITRAYLIRDVIIAKEQEHYRLTHNRNIHRRENIRIKRESFRIEHGLPAKVRDSGYDVIAAQGMPKPSPETPEPYVPRKSLEQLRKEELAIPGYVEFLKRQHGDEWEKYLPGGEHYEPEP